MIPASVAPPAMTRPSSSQMVSGELAQARARCERLAGKELPGQRWISTRQFRESNNVAEARAQSAARPSEKLKLLKRLRGLARIERCSAEVLTLVDELLAAEGGGR